MIIIEITVSATLSMMVGIMLRMNYMGIGEPYVGKVYVGNSVMSNVTVPVVYADRLHISINW